MDRLLAIGKDAKTVKGETLGYLTGILYLAPHTSGQVFKNNGFGPVVNVCPNATAQCRDLCLYTAGRGVMAPVQAGRVRKTRRFFENRQGFMSDLVANVARVVRIAERKRLIPTIRLNGTSDIGWEGIAYRETTDGIDTSWSSIMAQFPAVQFYDYTKSPTRMARYLDGRMPGNYHLTFSRSDTNDPECLNVLARGGNVAVVFSTRKGQALPDRWQGYKVVDGDVSDLRFLDHDPITGVRNPATWANAGRPVPFHGLVIGLRAKGRAKKHVGGFVVAV